MISSPDNDFDFYCLVPRGTGKTFEVERCLGSEHQSRINLGDIVNLILALLDCIAL